MIVLDAADLAVIAARTLGMSTDAALAVMDIPAAQAALSQAQPAEGRPGAVLSDRDAAAEAGVRIMHALLRHRPFPREGRQVAVCAGLQLLSLNGWQADLDPPATTAVVIEALAAGQLAAADAAAWLSRRLSPAREAHRAPRLRRAGHGLRRDGHAPAAARRPGRGMPGPRTARTVKAVASALATAMIGGVAILATACSSAPDVSPATPHHAASTSQVTAPARPAPASVQPSPAPVIARR